MLDTAGTKLRRARTLRKLSLEDASRATKIRVNQLADLESDEYSNFANLAYAKSFLIGYGRYLHVDVRPYLDGFADANTFGMDDYQYLSDTPIGIYRAPTRQQVRRKPQRRHFVLTALALGFLAISAFVWMTVITLRRLPDWDKLAAREEARERAAQHPATEAVNQPAATAPGQAPALIVPVAVPVAAPADAVPALPADDAAHAPAATLASANPALLPAGDPVEPLSGPGQMVRQAVPPIGQRPVVALAAGHVVDAVHREASQPQKVANDHPRE